MKTSTLEDIKSALQKKESIHSFDGISIKLKRPPWEKAVSLIEKLPPEGASSIELFKFSLATVRICLESNISKHLSEDDIANLILTSGGSGGEIVQAASKLCGFGGTEIPENPTG